MAHLRQGDRVRIDITDTTDPDFDHYHGRLGTVVETLSDDASEMTGETFDQSQSSPPRTDGVFNLRE